MKYAWILGSLVLVLAFCSVVEAKETFDQCYQQSLDKKGGISSINSSVNKNIREECATKTYPPKCLVYWKSAEDGETEIEQEDDRYDTAGKLRSDDEIAKLHENFKALSQEKLSSCVSACKSAGWMSNKFGDCSQPTF